MKSSIFKPQFCVFRYLFIFCNTIKQDDKTAQTAERKVITMLEAHKEFIKSTIDKLSIDKRIVGILAGGSFITGEMDEFSDIDLVIVSTNDSYNRIMAERFDIVHSMGSTLSVFTGEHVGEPRLLISLYEQDTLHVDFKFVKLDDVHKRVEDPVVLWQQDSLIDEEMKKSKAHFPTPDVQWIEDRFWVWVHYGALKIGRDELFETIDFISFLRQNVIGSLILMKCGHLPRGVRRIEFDAPEYLERLKQTVASHDKDSCIRAIEKIVELYIELREYFKNEDFIYRTNAQKATLAYFNSVKHANHN